MMLCCALLCVTLSLFCGSALAAVDVQNTDSTVTVTKSADETQFTVRKEGVADGQLYLVMIQSGDASALPTSENLYYLNVYTASGTTFEETVYPKDLTEGTYAVFLSDYAGTSDGGRKAVATLSVTAGGEDVQYQCGDVNHSGGNPDNIDLIILARYVGEWPDYMKEGALDLSLGDVNASGGAPDNIDLLILARYVGEWPDYPSLPHQ